MAVSSPPVLLTDSSVAKWLRANSVHHHIQYKEGRGWLRWNLDKQKWRTEEVYSYLDDFASKVQEAGAKLGQMMGNTRSQHGILFQLQRMTEFIDTAWDEDELLMGVAKGVIDLRTGKHRQEKPSDHVSLSTPTQYNPEAKCPKFDHFISQVLPDKEAREYVHRLLGSGLAADTRDQLFHFWLGTGANGKSVLARTVAHVLGPLAGSVPSSLFLRQGDPSANKFSLSRVQDCRLIFAGEVPGNGSLNESRVKELTGGDAVVVEEKGQRQQQVTFCATTIMHVNDIPSITDNSTAMKRRLRVVPFTQSFETNPNPQLADELKQEAEGILLWLIEGARIWVNTGLGYPDVIKSATGNSIRESFALHDFLDEVLTFRAGSRFHVKDLVSKYLTWAKERGVSGRVSSREWGDAIAAFTSNAEKGESNGIYYKDWMIRPPEVSILAPSK